VTHGGNWRAIGVDPVPDGGAVAGEFRGCDLRCDTGIRCDATVGRCGFTTMMRSRHLGHRMHAPFAPFSNVSSRRYSVMQHLQWTTMTMTWSPSRRIPFRIIGDTP